MTSSSPLRTATTRLDSSGTKRTRTRSTAGRRPQYRGLAAREYSPVPELAEVTTYGPEPTPPDSSPGRFAAAGLIRMLAISWSRMGTGRSVCSRKVRSSTGSTVGISGKSPTMNEPLTPAYIFSAVETSLTVTGVPSE
ncbi:hypothetical protein JOF35_007501 [Streptomyces demainii]|uniref:Uncharacterized protein n=1 Tax=Streptomyces demainii TaxID=588122 RepID=A0ABT9L374_9ACTN|nr:hypothetical protein [Streptomyces demainii]